MRNARLPRRGLLAAAPLALLAAPRLGRAAGFPDRPIRLIIPWAAGGSTDAQMRVFADIASRHLGQPLVLENRPGARGTLGAQLLLQSKPDGYTLSQIHSGVFSHPFMTKAASWDSLTDFTYIIALTGYLSGLAVRADAPWQSWPELMADARARPGQISYGSSGIGGYSHMIMAQLLPAERVEMLHVPYRGVAETTTALLGGQVDAIADSSGWAPHVEAGRMRLLAVWGDKRARRFPTVPAVNEFGHDIGSIPPYGIAGPKDMPAEIVARLHEAFRAAMFDPAHLAVLARYDMPELYMTGADYHAWLVRSLPAEKAVVEKLGLRLD